MTSARSILAAIVIVSPSAQALAGPAAAPNLSAIAFLKGTCQSFVVGGKDASRKCLGKLTNTVYRTGRSGFTFVVGDLAVVTFSGADSPAIGNRAAIRLDKVIFTLIGTGTPPNVIPASGRCTYTNPYAGPSHVNCSATTKDGPFSASFVSNGEPPDIQQF